MLEIIILGFIFWLGYHFGVIYTSWQLRDLIIKDAKREGIIDDNLNFIDKKVPNVHKLIVEKSNNILYLYDHEANSFVCQASTMEELAKLAKQYKNINHAAVLDGEEVYAFVNGVVKTDKEVLNK
jgi:exopolysaccharide biosynthesis protein